MVDELNRAVGYATRLPEVAVRGAVRLVIRAVTFVDSAVQLARTLAGGAESRPADGRLGEQRPAPAPDERAEATPATIARPPAPPPASRPSDGRRPPAPRPTGPRPVGPRPVGPRPGGPPPAPRPAADLPREAERAGTPSTAVSEEPPLPDIDHLTVPQIRARLRRLSVAELNALRGYEAAHAHRAPVLTAIDNRLARMPGTGEGPGPPSVAGPGG